MIGKQSLFVGPAVSTITFAISGSYAVFVFCSNSLKFTGSEVFTLKISKAACRLWYFQLHSNEA